MATPTYDQIADRAYHLWEEEGRPHGCDLDHWFRAEKELNGLARSGRTKRRTGADVSGPARPSRGRAPRAQA